MPDVGNEQTDGFHRSLSPQARAQFRPRRPVPSGNAGRDKFRSRDHGRAVRYHFAFVSLDSGLLMSFVQNNWMLIAVFVLSGGDARLAASCSAACRR